MFPVILLISLGALQVSIWCDKKEILKKMDEERNELVEKMDKLKDKIKSRMDRTDAVLSDLKMRYDVTGVAVGLVAVVLTGLVNGSKIIEF